MWPPTNFMVCQLIALPAKRRELRMRRKTANPLSRCAPCALRAANPPSRTHTSSPPLHRVVTTLSRPAAGPAAVLRARPKAPA